MTKFHQLIKTAAAIGLAMMLSGCVVYPAWGPYYHPHHWGNVFGAIRSGLAWGPYYHPHHWGY